MSLKLFNNLTRKKEAFEPQNKNHVRMYVCGITAYDECHLGHARAAVIFDVLYRYFQFRGQQVTYVRNFTDIDDKIIKKAQITGMTSVEVAEKYMQSYHEQMKRLSVLSPTHEPKATEHIPEMIALIETLIKKGMAYPSGTDVFFRVRKFSGYGKLSHKKIDDLESGARIEIDEKKEDPLDFALWKGSKPGEPFWESPWGQGRPGWHIECSAMSMKYLGEQFDLHGGGRDLSFPHHENEIAQSEGASGKQPFAKVWIHNGFVNINAEKMSKSMGNFKTVRDLLDNWPSEVIRFFLLSAHYASPLDFTEDGLKQAQETVLRFYETVQNIFQSTPDGSHAGPLLADEMIRKGLEDDLNTPMVIARVFEWVREANRHLHEGHGFSVAAKEEIKKNLALLASCLGLFGQSPAVFLEELTKKGMRDNAITEEEINGLIQERCDARSTKDFARSDEIRKSLESRGVIIKDHPDGTTTWSAK